ncbi:hypothetical protein AB0N62_45525 [Streptomyces sp. NPDC093982]|uniref:hypothetical protein n=1 Tax=Streptomyces sp. NPDC093982 TaxID=3155077 RepID=UPI00343AC0C5
MCRSCGFVEHADRNASRNIRARARQLWGSRAESIGSAPAQGAGRRRQLSSQLGSTSGHGPLAPGS